MVFTVVLLALYLFVLFGIYGIQTYSGILKRRCVDNTYIEAASTLTPAELNRTFGVKENYFDEGEFCRENSNGLWPGHLCRVRTNIIPFLNNAKWMVLVSLYFQCCSTVLPDFRCFRMPSCGR